MKKGILAIVISLIGFINVNAMQVGGVEYYTPSAVKLYNNLSQTSSTQISTGYISGSNFNADAQIGYYYGQVSTTTGGYGASWCISAPTTFMNGYIYNVQIVVANDNNREFNIVSNNNYDMLRLGYTLNDASTHSGTTTINFFGAIYDSTGVYIGAEPIIQNGVYVLTYLFTSKLNSQFICLPFKHTTNSSNEIEYFYGAKFDIVGQSNLVTNASLNSAISNSGLASASSVAQVQNSVNQVQQEINSVNDTLTEDHTYNQNASQNIDGEDEVDDLSDAEDQLFDNIDLSGADVNVSINPNANNFIWEIVNQLRQMNSNIILLITSALGLGIIKMILNR